MHTPARGGAVTQAAPESPAPARLANPRGLVGLVNLGNTCFMNSALQCLSNVAPLSEYFLGSRWSRDLNSRSPSKGEVASAFADLMSRLWAPPPPSGAAAAERPGRLKTAVAATAARFADFSQHDSQEFLRALLDALHDDTNRVRVKLAYEELKDPADDPDAAVSDAWWRYFCARNDSHVWNLFAGQLHAETRCLKCGHRSRAFDPVLDLSLPIRDGRDCTLTSCLQSFTSSETMNDWYCARCKRHQPAEKRILLFRLPPVLMLHLKRFSSGAAGSPGFGFSGGLRTKIAAGVTFPTEALDMRAFLSPASPELAAGGAAEYDLVGVVNHMGSLNGGHYVADARNRDSGQWNNFNDSHVRSTSSRALSPTAA